ncbi:MAG: hypothetical protein HYU97_02770 [Deltaproteobacteria bacterium]|nr:hypothetical protein [Deltaproteobacteria bacterium]
MKITLSERFQRDLSALPKQESNSVFSVLLKIPTIIKDIHRHDGMGLRKIHASGIYEARVGLGLRIVFGYKENEIFLHRVGNHDEIKRYLKNL